MTPSGSSASASAPPRSSLSRRFFRTDATSLARKLLGCTLVRTLADGTELAGNIVETEAYLGIEDKAAHTYGGRRTARNESMWQAPGTAYVYFTYGMHYCMNISAGAVGDPVAVLLRALEPVKGLARMRELRLAGGKRKSPLPDRDLCRGPARLCQALGIDRADDGTDLTEAGSGLALVRRKPGSVTDERVVSGPRVGIRYAAEWADRPLRFALRGSRFVSPPGLE